MQQSAKRAVEQLHDKIKLPNVSSTHEMSDVIAIKGQS